MIRRHMLIGARRFLSSRHKPERFSLLATALRVFHEQNGHFLVPYTFQVPQKESQSSDNNPWPQETHGLNLGREIRKFVDVSNPKISPELHNIRRQLDTVGFPQIRDWKRFQWEQKSLSALKTFKQIQGDLLVPRKFVVPEEDRQWPKPTWGLKLGSHVNFLRQTREKLTTYQVQDLDDIGFVWVVADYNWDVLFMPALRRYRQLYGHSDIPQNFVIREEKNNEWPKELQGYRLGSMVNRTRTASGYVEFVERDREELEQLSFYLNSNDQKWQENILPAFEMYHRVYRNCNINTHFIVPEEEPWPQSMWGMRLGFIARNIRNRGDFFLQVARDYEKLKSIGFVWNVFAAKWQYAVLPALHTYVRVYGDANVPGDFVVPPEDPWPEESHGLKLGELAASPMRRKNFADFIEIDRMQLEALGFFWSALPDGDISGDDAFRLLL
ncbi:Helicase associated domain-containing protein [Phytophthora infestans]|uniref:Helicase associated domain-containing protein n=1 Tax=Phytophthora infestans TaxID=4787 RepID=A0A8S9UUM9_PHYIN|nr:Helicase associated domain-containing protein [Phytophthora infestans]